MTARVALELEPPRSGPRRLNPVRDLGGVADLLERVFAQELDSGGRQMIREARAFSRTGPLIQLISPWSVAAGGLLPGFVWEQDGTIIGNVTVFRSRKNQNAWQVANVAVHPNFRRRRIATRLLGYVIDHIVGLNGRSVALQVDESNPAVELYQKLGFITLGSVTRWQSGDRFYPEKLTKSSRQLRRAEHNDWTAIWRLFSSANLAALGWPDPLQVDDFKPNPWRSLLNFLNGDVVKRWVAPAAIQGILDGYVEIRSQPWSSYRMTLRVRTPAADGLAGDLIAKGMLQIPYPAGTRVQLDHPSHDEYVDEQLHAAGFSPKRTLQLMKLNLEG